MADRGVAQSSPEFGDDELSEPAAEAPMAEEPMAEAPADAEPLMATTSEPGYSSSRAPDPEPEPVDETPSPAPGFRVSAEVGVYATGSDEDTNEGSRMAISPLLGLGIGLSDSLELAVALGLNMQNNGAAPDAMNQDSESAFVLGNPHLSLTRHSQIGNTVFAVGGGVGLPVASLPDDVQDLAITASAYSHGAALRGNWNQWLWNPDRFSATVHFASHAVIDELLIGGEAAVAAMIPTVEEGDMSVAGQLAAEIGYATDAVRVVMRVQGVATIDNAIEDPFQVSLDPYVAWNTSKKLTLTGRLTVNADNPAGVEGAGIWALRAGLVLHL